MNAKQILDELLIGYWEKIVTQGGEVERSPTRMTYLLSGIWIFCLSKWIEISAVDLGNDNFCLSISSMETSPIPEPSKLNNPPRKVVEIFPEDCKLDRLSEAGVKNIGLSEIDIIDSEILMKSPLIIESRDGFRFEISVSNECLGNIEIKQI